MSQLVPPPDNYSACYLNPQSVSDIVYIIRDCIKLRIASTVDGWGDLRATKWQNSRGTGGRDNTVKIYKRLLTRIFVDTPCRRSHSPLVMTGVSCSAPKRTWI